MSITDKPYEDRLIALAGTDAGASAFLQAFSTCSGKHPGLLEGIEESGLTGSQIGKIWEENENRVVETLDAILG